jgi:hypothetical protein
LGPGDHNLAVVVDLNGTIGQLKQLLVKEMEEVIAFSSVFLSFFLGIDCAMASFFLLH